MKYTYIAPAVVPVNAVYENDDGSSAGECDVLLWAIAERQVLTEDHLGIKGIVTEGNILGLVIVDDELIPAPEVDGFVGYRPL